MNSVIKKFPKQNVWKKYREKHRWYRVSDFPSGIAAPEKVRIYRQNDYYRLQFWDPSVRKNLSERVEGDLVAAISRAREIEERLHHFRSSGTHLRKQNHTDLIQKYQYFLQSRADAREISPKTVTRYQSALEHYQRFIQRPSIESVYPLATNVNRELVLQFQAYLNQLQISPNGHPHTPKRSMAAPQYVLNVVRAMYTWAADPEGGNLMPEGFRNPFLSKYRQSATVKPDLFGDPDITMPMAAEFLTSCDQFQLPIFTLLIFYGLRASEPCFLFRENLTSDGWLKVVCLPELGYTTKGRRDKRLPLIGPVLQCLNSDFSQHQTGLLLRRRSVWNGSVQPQLAGCSLEQLQVKYTQNCQKAKSPSADQRIKIRDQILQSAGGLKYDQIQNEFHQLAAKLSWPAKATLKDFRHLFSTALMNAGVPEYYRKYLMGHAVGRGAITNYTHLDQLREQYQAAVDREFQPVLEVVSKRVSEWKQRTAA
ncbi:tyrosine-type recombinase/integrase [Gimesia chilikensis]|uniref:tyrosine-type recombinase/integrase n=1 Tax=Gimesia chilikensis TaxID=2605989 RepID=UPI00118BF46C|nr:tyrosine-type recombinase/integrase [Gimesia chilikensis]QDT87388.1 site-specific tyrosine recombinase XerC [Gimesia chilikensis]